MADPYGINYQYTEKSSKSFDFIIDLEKNHIFAETLKHENMNTENTISKLQNKLKDNPSELLKIVIEEGIGLIESGSNPDRVMNWVNNIFNTYQRPPMPPTKKEIEKREAKKQRKQERKNKVDAMKQNINSMIEEFDIKIFAFIDTRSISYETVRSQKEMLEKLGYHTRIGGDGAFEIIVSGKEIGDKESKKIYDAINDINEEIDFWSMKTSAKKVFDSSTDLQKAITNLV